MHLSLHPILSWPLLAIAAIAVAGFMVWLYRDALADHRGLWRWLALALRLVALAMTLAAMLRPELVFSEKKNQSAALVLLADRSRSMLVADSWDNLPRWRAMGQTLSRSEVPLKKLEELLEIRRYQFDAKLSEGIRPDEPPTGTSTAIGDTLRLAAEGERGRIAAIVLLSDGANLTGTPPLSIAQTLRDRAIPLYTVGFGQEAAVESSRDMAMRSINAGPIVFEKNKLVVSGELEARGFGGQRVNLRLLFDGFLAGSTTLELPTADGKRRVELSYTPTQPGEHKVSLVVSEIEPKKGELVESNNEISTFVTVQKGGLRVQYVDGGLGSYEPKFIRWSLDKSPDIKVDFFSVRRKEDLAGETKADSPLFDAKRYDVFLVRDVPRDWFPAESLKRLQAAVESGAGFAMIGGRASFGPGSYANSPVAEILPVSILPGDPQLKEQLRVVPTPAGLAHFVMRLGSDAETRAGWESLIPLNGASAFTNVKERARVLAESPTRVPLVVAQDFGKGRTMALAADSTYLWYRQSDDGLRFHRRFWRQVILWLARKEHAGETRVILELAKRRIAAGEKLDVAAGVEDEQGRAVLDAEFEVSIKTPEGNPVPLKLLPQGDRSRGTFFGTDKPGDYEVTVIARRGGKELGVPRTANFLVYDDDAELSAPSADLSLLAQMAELTGGQYIQPERLPAFLDSLRNKDLHLEREHLTQRRLWDNWPFLIAFVALLSAEWALRKWKGLV